MKYYPIQYLSNWDRDDLLIFLFPSGWTLVTLIKAWLFLYCQVGSSVSLHALDWFPLHLQRMPWSHNKGSMTRSYLLWTGGFKHTADSFVPFTACEETEGAHIQDSNKEVPDNEDPTNWHWWSEMHSSALSQVTSRRYGQWLNLDDAHHGCQ